MSATLSPVGRPAPSVVSGKIQSSHLKRLAVVYVRQSTLQQVERHQESTRLQYALKDRAIELGWSPAQVLVIDEDLGRSGASAEGRPGFQRLVAEVGLDHIGLVLGIEISRLARSSRDWYQLLEVCALFSTLIGDGDGLYDPQTYNDRLLLGLKGTMSEAELHILKQRMLEGKRAKARRGELKTLLPMGYLRDLAGNVIKDPDAQARGVIETIFVQFERRGTLNGVLRYLVEHQLELPYRVISGPQTGQLQWRRPNRVTLSNLLHNPTYAGAYVYGRRPTDARRRQPGRPATGRTVAGPEQWQVLLKDRLPAYISWTQYEANLRQLAANTAQAGGVVRQGPSLLSGRLVCGRCGLTMATQYTNNGTGLRYVCSREAVDYGAPLCQSLSGAALDALITCLVLDALEPAALEISLQVAEDLEGERARHHAEWQQRLERAHYEAEHAVNTLARSSRVPGSAVDGRAMRAGRPCDEANGVVLQLVVSPNRSADRPVRYRRAALLGSCRRGRSGRCVGYGGGLAGRLGASKRFAHRQWPGRWHCAGQLGRQPRGRSGSFRRHGRDVAEVVAADRGSRLAMPKA